MDCIRYLRDDEGVMWPCGRSCVGAPGTRSAETGAPAASQTAICTALNYSGFDAAGGTSQK